VSRVYDALRKLEEQNKESAQEAVTPAPKTTVAPSKNLESLLSVPALEARVRPDDRIVVYTDRRGPGAERFRLIRMALRNSQVGKAQKVLLITSPLPRDGKSTVALNLATTLAENGKVNVLLLEADLHRPSLLSHLGLERMCGLTEVVQDMVDPASAIRRIEPLGFYLLAAGRSTEHPTEMLQTERFHALLRDFKACFEWVLVDCPPAFPLADVVALRAHADGVLLVARAGATPRESVEEAVQLFKPGQVVGMILNAAEGVNHLYSKYYYRKDMAPPPVRLGGPGDEDRVPPKGVHPSRNR
jgi:tyrosine-protein kinase